MILSTLQTILSNCDGIKVEAIVNNNAYSAQTHDYKFHKVGDIKVHDNIFIEITGTSTKGTIGKLIDIECDTYSERYADLDNYKGNNTIVSYGARLLYEVEGRKQIGRINDNHAKVLTGVHETKYVRDVKTHKKVVVKNPVNKFKQEMQVGDWVIGVKPGKRLGIGRITRWTNHNVWAVSGDDITDKSKEFKFDTITETFTMPDDKHVPLITMAVLKGYKGG